MGLKTQKTKQVLTLLITVILYQQPVLNSGLVLTVHSLFVMLKRYTENGKREDIWLLVIMWYLLIIQLNQHK